MYHQTVYEPFNTLKPVVFMMQVAPRPQGAPNKYCTGKDVIITLEVDTNGTVEILCIKEKK